MKRWTLHSMRSNPRTARIAFTGQKPVEKRRINNGVKECMNFGVFSSNFKSYRYRLLQKCFYYMLNGIKKQSIYVVFFPFYTLNCLLFVVNGVRSSELSRTHCEVEK